MSDIATITADLEVDSKTEGYTIDSLIVIIQRFADLVDQNSVLCREFVEAIKVVGDIIIKNILSEGEGYSNLLL